MGAIKEYIIGLESKQCCYTCAACQKANFCKLHQKKLSLSDLEKICDNWTCSTSEWYTPPGCMELVYQVLGDPVCLDPCCNPHGEPNVRAVRYYRVMENGLDQPWKADTVFLNPPYDNTGAWLLKLQESINARDVGSAIALVPVKTDTGWWHSIAPDVTAWCAWKGRIKFLDINREVQDSGRFPSAFLLLSRNKSIIRKFIEVFGDKGLIYI